jgi:hypothetical protein
MPIVTVEFHGICTFFSREHHPKLPTTYRVVLVNALEVERIDEHVIQPHVALLRIGGGEPIPMLGLRAQLRTAGAVRSVGDDDEWRNTIPNLTGLVEAARETMSAPSEPVVFGQDRRRTALHFDFDDGQLSACMDETVFSILTVDADEVWLELTPFPECKLPEGLEARVAFGSDATVVVSNDDINHEDKSKADFLLHYRTAAEMPPNPPVPMMMANSIGTVGAIGAGCSNSNYP